MIDKFTAAYIECALWLLDDTDEPLLNWYTQSNLAAETLATIIADCQRFQVENAADIAAGSDGPNFDRYERAGHDFFLTRNHHGAGFWDGDYSEEVGKRLTDAAHAYGDVDLYVFEGFIYAT